MLLRDLRLAARALTKTPSFTIIAVLSLGLGIGAQTSVFALTRALFFAPPAGVSEPRGLVRVCRIVKDRPDAHELSYRDAEFYRGSATAFSELATDGNALRLTDTERGEELDAYYVSANYFAVLGLAPHSGRFFLPEEDAVPGRDPVVVLSYGFWHRRFEGRTTAIGRTLRLRSTNYTIIGIAPRGFDGSNAGWESDVFIPNMMAPGGTVDLIGRLAPGRTVAEAQAEMSVLARQLDDRVGVLVSTLRGIHPEARLDHVEVPRLLAAVAAGLLAIACANLAGLFIARNMRRQREVAVLVALGATRGRIVRQLLSESLLLSAAGSVAGFVFASWGAAFLERAYAREMFDGSRHLYPVSIDAGGFVLSVWLGLVTAVLFGLVPAVQASRPALVNALKDATSTAPYRSRLRGAFLVAQLALSLVLLAGAALVGQSMRTLLRSPGFAVESVAYLNVGGVRTAAFALEVRRRLESLPMVDAMSAAWVPPPLWFAAADVFVPGNEPARPEDAFKVPANWVAPGFFETLRIPLASGRGVEARDVTDRRRAVVVNEALARRLWRDADPVGRTLVVRGKPFDVIGVARYQDLRARGETDRAFLFGFDPDNVPSGSLLVRVKGDPEAALPAIRREVLAADSRARIYQAMALRRVIANQYADVPLATGVLSFAGVLALILSAMGIYGVVAIAVAHRTREVGIRMALGATSSRAVRFVLRDGARVIALGVPIGVGASLAGSRLLARYLYGVSPTDPVTFAGAALFLSGVTMAAGYAAARRAARVDPIRALRQN